MDRGTATDSTAADSAGDTTAASEDQPYEPKKSETRMHPDSTTSDSAAQ